MFNTIKGKLILFTLCSIILIFSSVFFSYLIAIASIKSIMRTDVNMVADSLEKNITYIAANNPNAYKEDAFKKMIYSIKIGKSGIAYMIDPEGVLVVHSNPLEEGKNKKNENGIIEILANKGSGFTEYTTKVNSQEKIAAYRYIKAWNLWIVPGVNQADYFDHLKNTFLKWNIIFAVVVIIFFIIISTWISRTISRPLNGLLRIFKGNDDVATTDKETRNVLCRLLENML